VARKICRLETVGLIMGGRSQAWNLLGASPKILIYYITPTTYTLLCVSKQLRL
jgi:hypothetical protein